MTNVTHTTLAHINSLILAALSYEECMTAVRIDYANGDISKENARIALATGYVHHIGAKLEAEIKAIDAKAMKGAKANVERRAELADKLSALQAQRNPETGKAERSTALEQRVNRDLKAITASETAQVKTADKIVLTAAQVRLLKELDATFETYAAMRKGILSYIATAQ